MTGYFTKLELDRFSQKRLDLEANLWIHLNESELETWIEGWIDGVGMKMYSDAGLIEAQVVSAWQHETSVHEPGFLVATGLDSDEPVYRVLVLAAARPGTKVTFNPLQQARLEKDQKFEVVSEAGSADPSSDSEAESSAAQESEEESDSSVHTLLSSLETMSSEESDYQAPRRGMIWGIHLSDGEFRAWIRPGVLGVNHDEPFISVIGDEGLEMRAWRTLMMFRQRNDWPDDPIDISYGQSIIFTQEVQVQTAPRVFSTAFAVCVHGRNRDNHVLIGLCAYPSRPWITLDPIVVEGPAGAPEARGAHRANARFGRIGV